LFKALTPREILEDPSAVAGALKGLKVPLEGINAINLRNENHSRSDLAHPVPCMNGW
jgi:hypothetical protein